MKREIAEWCFRGGLSPLGREVWDNHMSGEGRKSWADRFAQGERLWDLQSDFENILVPYVLEELMENTPAARALSVI